MNNITSSSNLSLDMHHDLKSEVILQLINVETGEIEHEQTETNMITMMAYNQLFGNGGVINAPRLWISGRQMTNNAGLQNTSFTNQVSILELATLTPTVFTNLYYKTLSTLYIVEYKAQYNPPAVNRTIWSVGISNSSGQLPFSMVALTTSCTQAGTSPGPGQTLVVTYRVQVLNVTTPVGALPVGLSSDRRVAETLANAAFSGDGTVSLYSMNNFTTVNEFLSPIIPTNMGAFISGLNPGYANSNTGQSGGGANTINGIVTSGQSVTTPLPWIRYGSTVHSLSYANTTATGTIIGSFYYDSSSSFTTYGSTGMYASPAVNPIWQPVQNIFGHSSGGTEPFQQVSALATGTGIVNASGNGILTLGAITPGSSYTNGVYTNVPLTGGHGYGATANITVSGNAVTVVTLVGGGTGYLVSDNLSATPLTGVFSTTGNGSGFSIPVSTITLWTNPTFPEFYRVNVLSTGDVGTSNYNFSQRLTSGFTSNPAGTGSSYTTMVAPTKIMPYSFYGSEISVANASGVATGSFHENRVHPINYTLATGNMIKYNATSLITYDATGVTLYDFKANSYTSYDASVSSPVSLPVTAVQQCAVDSTGNIWVACAQTGLWKINVSGVTVTNYTTFNLVSTTNVYAVDVGHSDTVVIIVNGGLFTTTNYGTSWTTQSFTFVGISDSNWSKVMWIKVQANSPSLRSGIGYSPDLGVSGSIAWWSTMSGTGISGPGFGSGNFNSTIGSSYFVFKMPRILTASTTGDFWTFSISNPQYRYVFYWGTTQSLLFFQGTTPLIITPDFLYDFYGTPYMPGLALSTSESGGIPVLDSIGNSYGLLTSTRKNTLGFSYPQPYVNFNNGMTVCGTTINTNGQGFSLWTPAPNFYANIGSVNASMVRNQASTIFEEFVWNNYGWNGSSWVRGYHAPALDTSGSVGGPYNGIRYRFGGEAQAFTGRSCIVVPTAALTSAFTTSLTFATQANALTNLSGQSAQQQMLTWVNLTTNDKLRFSFNNGSGKVNIKATLGSSTFKNASTTGYITVATGSQTFTVTSGLSWVAGQRARATSTNNPGAFMEGAVTSYIGTSLIVNVDTIGIAGTFNNWFIDYAGINFGATPSYGVNHNVVLVINGTTAQCFIDGVQLGTNQTIPSLNFSAANAETVVGGNRVNFVDGIGFDAAVGFYSGTMVNALLDSSAWTGGNISAHNSAPTTYTTGTTVVQYLLTQSLAGLESKPTHSTSAALINGITTRFTSGISPSFVNGEYYTFGVCNGIMKDNATSFSHEFNTFILPVTNNFSTLDLSTIPSTTTSVTEPVCFRNYGESNTFYFPPGIYPVTNTVTNSYSFQTLTGNFTYVGTIANSTIQSSVAPITGNTTDTATSFFAFGVNDSTATFPSNYPKWAVKVKGDNTIDIWLNGASVASSVTTWVKGDTVTIQRVGTVFTFYKNATLLYTTSGGQDSGATVYAAGYYNPSGYNYQIFVDNHTITYPRPANIIAIGNSGTMTGKYDPQFFNIAAIRNNNVYGNQGDITVTISGYATPASVTFASISATAGTILASPPGPNNVILVPDAGYLIFNSGDAGQTVTVSCTVIKYNYS